MHLYTADLANRMLESGHEVHLLTTRRAPLDAYSPGVTLHTPVDTRDRGFSLDAVRPRGLWKLLRTVTGLRPSVLHLTGPHIWNSILMTAARRGGIPTIHTLHDLHPHAGAVYGRLLYLWNARIREGVDHILVHGQRYRRELLSQGLDADRVTCTLLTHLFVNHATAQALKTSPPKLEYEPWALFLGRFEHYKGLDLLIDAARRLEKQGLRVVVAGPGRFDGVSPEALPGNVEIRNHFVGEEEAVDLVRRCGLLVLPYVEASQSALVAAAHFFHKPVIATTAGALPEYVSHGETGWLIPAGDVDALVEALGEGLCDPQRLARMGDAGRAWYERQRVLEGHALEGMYAALGRFAPES
ncbi:glycosyltransferase family 4 protein [Chloroflexota bacterium]